MMRGSVSAEVSDFSASYYNPSQLARAEGTDLSVGYVSVGHSLSMNGQDMLPMVAGMLQNPKVTGRLTSSGKVVEGSTQMHGMGMMGQQMGDQMTNVLAKLPKHPVRKK